ncbi:hypothetical protein C8Q76DRAFT_605408, partial [Earliella scabrosa]
LKIHVIYEDIFLYCSPMALLRLSRTCSEAFRAVQDYIRLAFDINKHLLTFFSRPQEFRSLQARTGSLISGSMALQFFNRTRYPDAGLDVFVHKCHRQEVGRWLLQAGYQFVPRPHQDSDFEAAVLDTISISPDGFYALDGISSMLTFVRKCHDDIETKVQMVVAENAPMEVILSTHSTCVMNVINSKTAYCLFPRATLEERQSLLSCSSRGIYRNRNAALAKYAQRGYKITFHVPPETLSPRRQTFQLGWRWLDDENSWVLPLDVVGVDLSPPGQDSSAICNWRMQYGTNRGAVMHFNVLESDVLRYRYLISDQDLSIHISRFMTLLYKQGQVGDSAQWTDLSRRRTYDAMLPTICRDFLRTLAYRQLSCVRIERYDARDGAI